MQIHIPEDLGSDLRLLPAGTVEAALEKIIYGTSQKGNPKVTFKYIATSEMEGVEEGEPPTIGETILETFSLMPNALFRLNDVYKAATQERLPQGDFTKEQFLDMLDEALIGHTFRLMLDQQLPSDGSSDKLRTVVIDRILID